jgi:chorismate mutase
VDYLWISMHLMKVQNSYSSCIRFQIMVAFSDRRLE